MTSVSTESLDTTSVPVAPGEGVASHASRTSAASEDHSKRNGVVSSAGGEVMDDEMPTTEIHGSDNNDNNISGNNKQAPSHGFRMQAHVHKTITNAVPRQRKRKRELAGSPGAGSASTNMSLSSSSSSSSDEEEHDAKRTAQGGQQDVAEGGSSSDDALGAGQSLRQHPQRQQQQQGTPMNGIARRGQYENDSNGAEGRNMETATRPKAAAALHPQSHASQTEGWRVKLYRLNADGSWDDCGTGSILCLYKKGLNQSSTPPPSRANNTAPSPLTGDAWIYHELGEPTLCMHSEVKNPTMGTTSAPRILLRTRILLRDAYQRQGDNIITWCEPYMEEGNPAQGVDLALSFQDIAGCLDIWRQITQVQSKASELFRRNGGDRGGNDNSSSSSSSNNKNRSQSTNSNQSGVNGDNTHNSKQPRSMEDAARAVAAAHHADLQRQQQEEMWVTVASEAAQHHLEHQNALSERDECRYEDGTMVAAYHESSSGPQSASSNTPQSPQLPNPPRLANLEEIADTIAAVQHIQQRDSLAMFISLNECSYLKSLLSLFPSAESRGDYGSLATLAACIKTILLLNDPSIIELIVNDELIFEEVCSTLEYDPDLRDKANHRWFLRERAKFRTVALMEDEELVASIHRSFRVNYLRDTLLRPTMDEGSLSTLSSLQTFAHADVVKGVTMSPVGSDDKGGLLKDSYLATVIRIFGRELEAICDIEWQEIEDLPPGGDLQSLLLAQSEEPATDSSTVVATGKYPQSQKLSRVWKQYLAPQDDSLASRRIRRRGALSFLRELFNMVRISLQQSDREDFFAVLVSMEVDLDYGPGKKWSADIQYADSVDGTVDSSQATDSDLERKPSEDRRNPRSPSRSVNLLSLLGTFLADPSTDVTEKGSVLEIISGIAMHDPSLIRRRCLDAYMNWRRDRRRAGKHQHFDSFGPIRPTFNGKKQTIFHCPPNELLGSLIFLLATETDAGVVLQVSEIMRMILDTDMMADHGPLGAGFTDEAEGIPPGGIHNPPHEQHANSSGSFATSTDQDQFLSLFYDHYVQWLAAPFQYKIMHPVRRIPRKVLQAQGQSRTLQKMIERFEKGQSSEEPLLRQVPMSAIRGSFAVELLSFCVRAHLYRMKCYLLRSRVLGNVLKALKPTPSQIVSGERCLALAALRFLRSILSVNDEFYHRHIIQHNLFAPVFEAFRANPVGDNLVSSAIVEMCAYIHSENIKSLVEHIVTKHLSASSETPSPSLEDVSSPYVSTLTVLRQAYEKNLNKSGTNDTKEMQGPDIDESHTGFFHTSAPGGHVVLNEKAREDQRKFREVDQEESYFDADDDEGPTQSTVVPPGVDEVDAQGADNEMHRTPRMFSLAQAPLTNSETLRLDHQRPPDVPHEPPLEVNPSPTSNEGVSPERQMNGELIK